MRTNIVTTIALAVILGGGVAACGASQPLPQAAASAMSAAPETPNDTTLPGGEVPENNTPEMPPPAPVTAPTTCDVAREALLTGTPAQITSALKKLQADRTADADAREAAKNYLTAEYPDMRELYETSITFYCDLATIE